MGGPRWWHEERSRCPRQHGREQDKQHEEQERGRHHDDREEDLAGGGGATRPLCL
jgi:hypothetical protein